MKSYFEKLKANDYVITMSSHKAARNFSVFMMIMNLLFYFWLTPTWVSGKSQFGPSPQFMPNALTIAMFVCALIVAITEHRMVRKQNEEMKQHVRDIVAAEKGIDASEAHEDDMFDQVLKEMNRDDVVIELRGVGYILAAILGCVFYVFCADFLGFIITMAIIVAGLLLLYGVRSPKVIILTTLVMSVGIYLVFTKLLSLVLPVGQILRLF